jgi:hypothetical protein
MRSLSQKLHHTGVFSWTSIIRKANAKRFSYGPFREIPLIPDDELVLSPEILKKTVRKSLPLMFSKFIKSLCAKDFETLQQLTRPRFYSEMEKLFAKGKARLEIINQKEAELVHIDYIKDITKLYGFNPSEFDFEKVKARGASNLFPGFKVKRILYKPSGRVPRPDWFRGVTFCDVLINTNMKLKIIETKRNGTVHELLKQRDLGGVNYIVQFVCKSQYEALAPPGLNEEIALPFEVKEWRSLNLQFWRLERQADYEAQGWRINDINNLLKKETLLESLE